MIPFLKSVANAYFTQHDVELHDCCFIFPNRRSGIFFKKHLEEMYGQHSALLPHITTIKDFVGELSEYREADRIELLFILYRTYRDIITARGGNTVPFGRFIFWGDMILSDFNDIDMNMADATKVFQNTKENNELRTDFLEEDQKRAIEELFGLSSTQYIDRTDKHDDTFWIPTGDNDSDSTNASKKFLKLWEILEPLYTNFNRTLIQNRKLYSGAMYRNVATSLSEIAPDDFEFKRYIFVGFNMLTESEQQIFKKLQAKGIADYYWDCNSPILLEKENIGTRFILKNKEQFPSIYSDFEEQNTLIPEVAIVSVPSNIGQAKIVAELLGNIPDNRFCPSKQNALNTAIVLPDENLFIPVYSSIPHDFGHANVTLGTPLRIFSITSLFSAIIALHKRKWVNSEGLCHYFHEDVKNLLSHHYLLSLEAQRINECVDQITRSRKVMIPASQLEAISPTLAPIFTPINENNCNATIEYVQRMMNIIEVAVGARNKIDDDEMLIADDKLDEMRNAARLDAGLIELFHTLIARLKCTLNKYTDIDLQGETYLYLIDRLIGSSSVALEGEPLLGLQIMGVLETRCLDFDNLIVLSTNEKVFPRKMFGRSMIPQNLRRGHGLSTVEHQESIYAYYFYRMISRARHIYLIHDSSTQSRSEGEESRYVYQLKYLFNKHIHINEYVYNLSINPPQSNAIIISKNDPRIQARLNRYRDKDPQNARSLSASALKKYLLCPMQFYLMYVEDMRPNDDTQEDFIDSATFGTVIHNTMKELYYGEGICKDINVTRDAQFFKSLKKSVKLDTTLTRQINKEYYNVEPDTEPTGECRLIAAMAKKYIHAILDYDAQIAPITFVTAENKEEDFWDMGDGIGINFKQYIDRIDRVNGITRIVDYKTGSDDISVKSIDTFFDPTVKKKSKCLGIFQLILYCNFHDYIEQKAGHEASEYQPVMYKPLELTKNKDDATSTQSTALKFGNQVIENHSEYNPDFMDKIKELVTELFDTSTPFTQTDIDDNCKYCDFANICKR